MAASIEHRATVNNLSYAQWACKQHMEKALLKLGQTGGQMRTLSLSPIAALVVGMQILSPATAQGLDQIYQNEQNQDRIKQERCRAEFDSAQFAGLSPGRRTGSRYKINFNSGAVFEIISMTGADTLILNIEFSEKKPKQATLLQSISSR